MTELKLNKIYQGDALDMLGTFPDESINMCVTSPPYWGLRDYGVDGQMGHEQTPDEYVFKMVKVFQDVRRVLRGDGTLWLNLGDSYYSASGNMGDLKPKQLIGIPWRVALALQEDGWYLRSDIIWNKPNPMPESVKDRPTRAHEYVFLLSKSDKYYYDADAIKEPCTHINYKVPAGWDQESGAHGRFHRDGRQKKDKQRGHSRRHAGFNERWYQMTKREQCCGFRNKRSVWTIATRPFTESHFATFPSELIAPCILAGCPKDGVVLDPFMGAGTTALVSKRLNCFYVGIELNPAYIDIAERRIKSDPDSLFAPKLQC